MAEEIAGKDHYKKLERYIEQNEHKIKIFNEKL